jgi:hypothetical protein
MQIQSAASCFIYCRQAGRKTWIYFTCCIPLYQMKFGYPVTEVKQVWHGETGTTENTDHNFEVAMTALVVSLINKLFHILTWSMKAARVKTWLNASESGLRCGPELIKSEGRVQGNNRGRGVGVKEKRRSQSEANCLSNVRNCYTLKTFNINFLVFQNSLSDVKMSL